MLLTPGKDSTLDVQARVYLREPVGKLGIAPLTSMYLFGANQPSDSLNFRPQLHDSEGLAIHAGNGEWLWPAEQPASPGGQRVQRGEPAWLRPDAAYP